MTNLQTTKLTFLLLKKFEAVYDQPEIDTKSLGFKPSNKHDGDLWRNVKSRTSGKRGRKDSNISHGIKAKAQADTEICIRDMPPVWGVTSLPYDDNSTSQLLETDFSYV